MTNAFPYSYVRCPCVDEPSQERSLQRTSQAADQDDEQNKTFDPKSPRANYSLYPLEHLMWCEDCHEIRCPRCIVEEVVCWYCPTCLFEVASGMIRNEGTRCTRNCHNCPVCTAPLAINSLDKEAGGLAGPWILACEYCSWTTLDVGIKFEKPNNIFGQLSRIYSGKPATSSSSAAQSSRAIALDEDDAFPTDSSPIKDHDARFRALRSFYATQLSKAGGPTNPLLSPGAVGSGDVNYNSPSTLARIMAMYTTSGSYGRRGTKPAALRPAVKVEEGVLELSPGDDAMQIVQFLRAGGLDSTADAEQRRNQIHPPATRFLSELRPVPVQLRTKRSRRCRACRHILVRPETKVSSTRYRIKLVATSYVPSMTLAPLPASASAAQGSQATTVNIAAPVPPPLPPSRPLQFLLTLRNPMFDAIRVTLASPPVVLGASGSRVTILCPTFEVGAHTDAWDDALGDRRRSVLLGSSAAGSSGERVAEAGKVWEKGRNWTSVVVEVVCGRLLKTAPRRAEDEDVLEIPVHVRLEYEAEVGGEDGGAAGAAGPGREEKREKRELAYWCVLGVGRIERVDA